MLISCLLISQVSYVLVDLRCNGFRERKYWWPVFIWIVRKRADQAYKAYKLTCLHELNTIDKELAKPRLAAARKKELGDKRSAVVKSEINHFDFLEDVSGYHIIKVPRTCM